MMRANGMRIAVGSYCFFNVVGVNLWKRIKF